MIMNRIYRHIILSLGALLAGGSMLAQDHGTAAISAASGEDLAKIADVSLVNTFAGALSGLYVMQGSGEFGSNGASYRIRGIGSYGMGSASCAKIFVDGFEVNRDYMDSISPSEIETVEILKDAAALVLYGEKGANGVIRITTRRGKAGSASVRGRVRYGAQMPQSLNKPLGSADYATLYNHAWSNDNGMAWQPVYSPEQIEAYRTGRDVDVDWYGEAMRKVGHIYDADVTLSGGSEAARYNVSLDYMGSKGLLSAKDTDKSRNLGYNKFNVRANLDFKVLKIFEVRLDIGGRIEFLHRPAYSISKLFGNLARYPSNIYDVYDDGAREHYSGTAVYPDNPYASVNALGWHMTKGRSLQTNIQVKERLDMVTPGLYLEEAVSLYSRTLSTYSKTRNYARYYGGTATTTDQTTTITASGYGSAGMDDWKQGRLTAEWERSFGGHNLSAAVNWNISAYKGDGDFSFKYNTLNLNGFLRYDYNHRYIAELGFSEFGNDAYAKGHRWAAYPALSAAWVLSNENFLKGSSAVQDLRLRASAGLSGFSDSDATSVLSGYNSAGRFLFKDYYTNSYIGTFYTGATNGTWQSTLVPMFSPNAGVHAEKSLKFNVGLDADLFGGLHVSADFFMDRRYDILTLDNSLMGYYGKQYAFSNIGRMSNRGFELQILYKGHSGDWTWQAGGNVCFARNRVDYMAEVAPANDFSAATGRPYGTIIGLVADGFYGIHDLDDDGNLVEGLPAPSFGAVQPGDVKYLDLDRNGVVDQNDVTKIGRSRIPEWTFAFGGKLSYKGFDLEVLFSGMAGVSVSLLDNWDQTVAFVDNRTVYEIARGAWVYYPTEGIDNRAAATYPRLTTRSNENNYRQSSLWVKDASFIKLRNLEIGYSFSRFRIFANGQNFLTISPFKWKYNLDPESVGGLYPHLASVNAGVCVNF